MHLSDQSDSKQDLRQAALTDLIGAGAAVFLAVLGYFRAQMSWSGGERGGSFKGAVIPADCSGKTFQTSGFDMSS